VLTDPPYCSGGFQEAGRSAGSIGTDAQIVRQIANDRLSTRGYMALIKAAIGATAIPLAYVFTDWRMWVNLFDVMESSGFGVRNMIVWDKGSPGMGMGWRTQHELVMFASRAAVQFDGHKAQGNVISASCTGNPDHPTQKPVELLSAILEVTDMAKTVYDPFLGSGGTLVSAHRLGRVCYGCELDPKYADVVLRRAEAEGLTAEREHANG
jgi:DNA modification methylase